MCSYFFGLMENWLFVFDLFDLYVEVWDYVVILLEMY